MNRSSLIRDVLLGLLILLVQVGLFRHLTVLGAAPDLPFLFVMWISARHGKVQALLTAFSMGLVHDAFVDLWGMHAFSSTLIILLAHRPITMLGKQTLLQWQSFLLILFAALAKNLVFFLLGGFIDAVSVRGTFYELLLAGALYTAVIGSFLQPIGRST